jgi:hypothetical protein
MTEMRRALAIVAPALAVGCRVPPERVAPPEIVLPASPPASEHPPDPPRPSCPARQAIGIVTISPDRRVIVTTCSGACFGEKEQQPVDVWDVAAGGLAQRVDMDLPNVVDLSWGAGVLAAVADPSTGMGHARLWNAATWALLGSTDVYCFANLAFDRPGKRLVLAGCNGTMAAVDTAAGTVVHRPVNEAHIPGDYGIEARFNDDGSHVLVADEHGGLQVLRAATLVRESGAPSARMECWAFAPRKDRFVAVDDTGTLELFDAARPRSFAKLAHDKDHPCSAIAWIDGGRFAVAREDGSLAVWDAERARLARSLRAAGSAVHRLAADPSGALLASTDADDIVIWEIATGAVRQTIRRHPAPDAGTAFDMTSMPTPVWSPSGQRFAALADGEAVVWDGATGAVAWVALAADQYAAKRLAWSPDGAVLAFTDGDAHLLRVADRSLLKLSVFEREGRRVGLVTSSDGRFAGPADLARCAPGTTPATREEPRLLAELFAAR